MALNLLFVDDEKEALSSYMQVIIGEGDIHYHFIPYDFLGAIDYVSHNDVDLAFMDIQMSTGSGIDLAKRILEIQPDVKIAFITVYSQKEEELKEIFGESLIEVAYKPFDKNALLRCIDKLPQGKQEETRVEIQTFGLFQVWVNGVPISFHSKKLRELFALMVAYPSSTLEMEYVISLLWPNHDVELAKRLYHDAVFRLRLSLKESGVENLCEFQRGRCNLNTTLITCDYWSALQKGIFVRHYQSFLQEYAWSAPLRTLLGQLPSY